MNATATDAGESLSAGELAALCGRLSARAIDLRVGLPEDTRGRVILPYSQRDLLRTAARLCGSETVPKASRLSGLMAALGVSGWWSPCTGEAVVDCTLPAAALPFTLCHELAHARGITGEAEANLYAYKTCLQGESAFRYSGAVSALWYAMDALRAVDENAWQKVVSALTPGVTRDIRAMNGLDPTDGGPLQRLQDVLTGLYLRLTHVSDYKSFIVCLA